MTSLAFPRRLVFGGGSVNQLGSLIKSLGYSYPIIITDPFHASSPSLSKVTKSLIDKGYSPSHVFSKTEADPTTSSVDLCASYIKSKGPFDVIVALGGGSAMDTAKAAGVLARWGGRMVEYKAPRVLDETGIPVVAIPTTAGTGSEATRFTIVTDSETNEKMLCVGLAYLPVAAVVDYELTMTMPYRLTADTGIDAFCHAMEAFVSKRRNSFSDTLALRAVNRIATSLRRACEKPDDRVAREQMMLAATEAGIAFSNSSVTLIHGASRPIGAMFHVPHGLSNAMLAPAITEFSLPGAIDRYAQVAKAAEFSGLGIGSDQDAAESLVRGLKELTKDLRVPRLASWTGLTDPAIFESVVSKMAADAVASGSPNNNPIVPTVQQIESLYRQIYYAKEV